MRLKSCIVPITQNIKPIPTIILDNIKVTFGNNLNLSGLFKSVIDNFNDKIGAPMIQQKRKLLGNIICSIDIGKILIRNNNIMISGIIIETSIKNATFANVECLISV